MFKEDNRIYWYLIGLVIIIALALVMARDFLIPFIMLQPTPLDEGLLQLTESPAMQLDFTQDYYAVFKTNHGDITVDLLEDSAPQNVNNVVVLSNGNFYAGTKFHRLVPDLILQGGDRNTLNEDPGDDGFGGPGYFVVDEVNWEALGLTDVKQVELYSKGYRSNTTAPSAALDQYVLAMASATQPTFVRASMIPSMATEIVCRMAAIHARLTIRTTPMLTAFATLPISALDTTMARTRMVTASPMDAIFVQAMTMALTRMATAFRMAAISAPVSLTRPTRMVTASPMAAISAPAMTTV